MRQPARPPPPGHDPTTDDATPVRPEPGPFAPGAMLPSRCPSQAEHSGSLTVNHSVHPVAEATGRRARPSPRTRTPCHGTANRRDPAGPAAGPSGRAWRRGDAGFEQAVDEPVVVVEPDRVGLTGAVGQHPRPRDREAVGVQPESLHQSDVFGVAVVVVACDIAGVAVVDRAGNPAEGVPNGRRTATLGDRSLDLVRRCRRAPTEIRRQAAVVHGGLLRGRVRGTYFEC